MDSLQYSIRAECVNVDAPLSPNYLSSGNTMCIAEWRAHIYTYSHQLFTFIFNKSSQSTQHTRTKR